MDPVFDNDSDEEPENVGQIYSGKSGFVFLLDVSRSMFKGQETYFKKSFECCLKAMLQIAREQRYDLVSIVLFGANVSEGKFAPHGVVMLQNLLTPSIVNIQIIKSHIEDNFEEIINKYGHGKVYVDRALNYCKNLFHFCKTKLYTKSLVIFTCEDNPHANDYEAAHRARKRAVELREHGIDLDVVGLGDFNSSLFYKELVLTTRGELLKDWTEKDPVKKINDVLVEIASITKRAIRRYSLIHVGKKIEIKVQLYKLYQEPNKLIWTSKVEERENENLNENEELKDKEGVENNISRDPDNNQGKELPHSLTKQNEETSQKYPCIGGKCIQMSKKELQRYEAKVKPGLTLIGFKPLSTIPKHTTLGEPYFVIPDSSHKGNVDFFSTLLHSCLRKNVAPVCWYSVNKVGNPILAVLYPTEPAAYAKEKTHPYGFHLIKIPFSDQWTEHIDDVPEAMSSETQIVAANEIIKKTTMNWSPDTFSDCEYKSRIAMIEAIAMEYDDVEEIPDDTVIDLEALAERIGDLSFKFSDCSHLPADGRRKRGDSDERESIPAKEPRIEDISSLISMIKAGESHRLTVAQLREVLRGEGIKSLSALPKPRLIALAEERFIS